MAEDTLKISEADTAAERDDRFHRFKLIGWWDQTRLAGARVLVIGAGALGNEIVKNLALLGIGNVLIADMDRIENSNLSRSVLYRENDNGRFKATVAARAAAEIFPGMKAVAFNGNVVYDLGLGVYRWADVVIGGLDNREARLSINRACYKLGRTWIDGAIEQIDGAARVFSPPGPCYECTMSETDWRLLQMRRSCNLLSKSQMQLGKTPTTPTISSIIAGIQCQEAVKHLHAMETIAGRSIIFSGLSGDCYTVEFQRKADCMSHEPLDEVISISQGCESITLAELLDLGRSKLGNGATLELSREVLWKFICPKCDQEEEVFLSLGKVGSEMARCPGCGGGRDVRTFYKIDGSEEFLNRTPAMIGLPPFDILTVRSADRTLGVELSGDRRTALGVLADGDADDLEWT